MNFRNTLIAGAIILIGIVSAGVLYSLSSSIQTERLERAADLLQTLQQLDSQWSVEVLQVSSNPLADFDGLAALAPEVRVRSRELRDIARTEPGISTSLKSSLLSYVSRLDSKEERIERFKSAYAIVRNSQRYLPLAAELVTAKTMEFNQGTLANTVKAQHADLENYFSNPSELDKQRIVLSLDTLRVQRSQYPDSVGRALGNFLAHALVLLEQKGPLDELRVTATGLESASIAQGLAGELKTLIQSRNDQRTHYQQFAFGALLLMLAALSAHLFFARRGPVARSANGGDVEDTLDLSSDTLHLYGDSPSPSTATSKTLSPDAAQRIEQEYLLQALRAGGRSLSSHMNLLSEIQHDVSSAVNTGDAQTGAGARLKEVQDIMKEKSAEKVLLAMHRTVRTIDRASKELHQRARAIIEVERGAFDLVTCVERAIDAESKMHPNVKIERDLLPSAMTTGAAHDITAVIQSILANSMQSFDSASTSPILRVQMSQDQNNVTVTVTDNGPGMEQKIRQAAVAAFYSSKDGHSGLGLSVALYIAKKHGGTLQLNSVPGKGTAVRLILPANPAS